MSKEKIDIYTDGSCHTQKRTGSWAAILLTGIDKVILEGIVEDTTHNRMELLAVLKSIEHINEQNIPYRKINIYSDSQYVVDITERKEKLKRNQFLTAKGTQIQNADLVQELIEILETYPIVLIKIKAHQKETDVINYNREVDKIVRKLLRSIEN